MYQLRRIFKRSNTSKFEVKELLQFIFLGELLSPSKDLWIVSPWLSNIPILDNSLGQFSYLDPNWPRAEIRLKEILIRLMNQGQNVNIVYLSKDKSVDFEAFNLTNFFVSELNEASDNYGISKNLHSKFTHNLHVKGLLTDKNFLSGSMNFTYNGLTFWEELITFDTNIENIAVAKINFMGYFENHDKK